ncbi:MAG: hypothetical protein NT058_00600 [Candidatus Portnoybacteria bacterium]|nr:hypothetical protein [Candidatus Portnoybacteria bacterium]
MKKILLILLVLIIIAGGIWYFTKDKPIACTEEAKLCPDGTAVGRTGESCEFAECPIADDQFKDWKTYTNAEYGYEIQYPATLKVNENVSENVSIGSEAVPYIAINIYQGKTNMDFESVVQEILNNEYGALLDMDKVQFTQKEIQGIMSIEASFKQVVGGYDGTVIWDYIPKDQKVYRVALLSGLSINGVLVPYATLHDQILSTFKFIE